MILVDTRWHSGLYDFDGETLSRVLKLYKDDDTVHYKRFEYSFNEDYKGATEKDIELYKREYYDDEGNSVF